MTMSRLYEMYRTDVVPRMKDARGYRNTMEVPRLEKIVVNMGISSGTDKALFDAAVEELAQITGQRPVVTRARQSISNFRLRQGQPVGCKVTLRGKRMYEFLDRLVNVALPRVRDFRGVSPRSFDGRGNYSLGISDQSIFPEIDLDKIKKTQGMDITIATSARSDEDARELLRMMGMPFSQS
jgi:large subunit ribosomal protein L5